MEYLDDFGLDDLRVTWDTGGNNLCRIFKVCIKYHAHPANQ